jgi:hypothetical protein
VGVIDQFLFIHGTLVNFSEIAFIEQGSFWNTIYDFEHFSGPISGKYIPTGYIGQPAFCIHLKHSQYKIIVPYPSPDHDKVTYILQHSNEWYYEARKIE